jgi:hypothetical protein
VVGIFLRIATKKCYPISVLGKHFTKNYGRQQEEYPLVAIDTIRGKARCFLKNSS